MNSFISSYRANERMDLGSYDDCLGLPTFISDFDQKPCRQNN